MIIDTDKERGTQIDRRTRNDEAKRWGDEGRVRSGVRVIYDGPDLITIGITSLARARAQLVATGLSAQKSETIRRVDEDLKRFARVLLKRWRSFI